MSLKSDRSSAKDRDRDEDRDKKKTKESKKKDKDPESDDDMKSGKSSKKTKKSDKDRKQDKHDDAKDKSRNSDKSPKKNDKKARKDSSDDEKAQTGGGMLKSMKDMMKDIKAKPIEYDDEREYALFFEQMILPLIHRMKTDLVNERPRDLVSSLVTQIEYCMDWIDKEKRGDNRTKLSKYEKQKVEEEEADHKRRAANAPKEPAPPALAEPPKPDVPANKPASKPTKVKA